MTNLNKLHRLAALAIILGTSLLLSAQTPNADDVIWQKSVQKYDVPRSQYLSQVDAANQHGKFRPAWDSLGSYQVPERPKQLPHDGRLRWPVGKEDRAR